MLDEVYIELILQPEIPFGQALATQSLHRQTHHAKAWLQKAGSSLPGQALQPHWEPRGFAIALHALADGRETCMKTTPIVTQTMRQRPSVACLRGPGDITDLFGM